MRVDDLLQEVAGLSHRDRMRRLIALGRAASGGDGDAREVLDELGRSDEAFLRSLALAAAFATRDADYVIARLDDGSRTLRLRADKLLVHVGSDEAIAAALARMPVPRTTRALFMLKRRRRQGVIDAYVGALTGSIEPARFDLIPLASPEVCGRFKASFAERLGPAGFQRLAKHAPELLAESVLSALEAGNVIDVRLAARLSAAAGLLARNAPELALDVFERLLLLGTTELEIARSMARALLRSFPQRVFDALRARMDSGRPVPPPGVFGIVRYDRVAHRLGGDRLAHLVEHGWSALSDDARARRWFLRLEPPDRERVLETWLARGRGAWGAFLLRHVSPEGARSRFRDRAYRRWSHAAQNAKGVIELNRLRALPRDLCAREGRRHLHDVTWLESRPIERIAYAALLPFEDAKAELAAFLSHPEGEVRSHAICSLISSIEREPSALAAGLELLLTRKFEQDPVRVAMLDALARLPRGVFASEHLERIGRVLKDAFEAADRSPASTAAAERLITRLFRVDALWGATWLAKLLEIHGSVSTLGLGDGLSPRDIRALEPGLSELASTWVLRERANAILWLARSLGNRRLRHSPSLIAALERLAKELPFAGVAAAALALLRKEAPRRFRELVPALLLEDQSFAMLPEVARFVARQRQELAILLLADKPVTGRFASGRSHWVIDFGLALGSFTPYVQRGYQAQLLALATAEKTDLETQRFAIERLSRLPFVAVDPLLELCRDPRQTVREIAVRSLAWVDGPAALPALIVCLGDERARWAIYALRRVFAELPRATVLAHLRAVPVEKVTVAKEVVRLLGDMGGDDGFDALVALDGVGLHRDVRIALLHALWNHLERDATWDIFERAVSHPDWIVAAQLSNVPHVRLSEVAEARLGALYSRILRRPEPEARLALLSQARFLPLRDGSRVLFEALLARLDAPPDEAAPAMRAVLSRMLPGEVDRVVASIRVCFAARETLVAVLAVLRPSAYAAKHEHRLVESVLDALGEDHLAVAPRIELAGHVLGYRRLSELLIQLAAQNLLHYDAMTAALEVIPRCVHPELLEMELAKQRDPLLRRLALRALVSAASAGRGWNEERRGRLEKYRGDPALLVASAAAYVFPPARRTAEPPDTAG